MSAVKIVLIGAGSRSFGPAMVKDIVLSEPLSTLDVKLVLMDRIPDAIAGIKQYACDLFATFKRPFAVVGTTDLTQALEGADYVITAIEVDRYLHWSEDFHIPRKYGFRQVYGENGGPGGLFHALRNMIPVVEIAQTMERLCPHALLLNFTNPESKVCEALTRLTSIQTIGLCHGIFGGIAQAAFVLGIPREEIEVQACGINHFTWFQQIRNRQTGEDLYPRLREMERQGDWLAEWHEIGIQRVLFRRFGLWPSPGANHIGEYVRWAEEFVASEMQYFYDPADGHPWENGRIPEFVYTIGHTSTSRPFLPVPATKTTPAQENEITPSGELAIPIVEGISCGLKRVLEAVNVTNQGAIPGLPDDMVVEVPAAVDKHGTHPCQMAPLPEGIAAMLRLQGSIHRLLVEAFAERSRDKLLQALLLDPTVDSYRRAVGCMEEMIAVQRALLPAFGEGPLSSFVSAAGSGAP